MVTPHLLVGAAVAKLARRPQPAWPLAFASHFVLDAIPHVDAGGLYGQPDEGFTDAEVLTAAVDFMVGASLVGLLALPRYDRWLLLGGAFCGLLPDLVELVPGFGPWLGTWPGTAWYVRGHHGIQHILAPPPLALGIATQVITAVTAVWVIRHHWRRSALDTGGSRHSGRFRGWQV
jgi:hypothetical protein